MKDFILASRVRAALAKDALTSNLEVDVESHAGEIIIKGELCEQNEEVQRVAAAVPGVLTVNLREPVRESEPSVSVGVSRNSEARSLDCQGAHQVQDPLDRWRNGGLERRGHLGAEGEGV